jgi:hypothetical protein
MIIIHKILIICTNFLVQNKLSRTKKNIRELSPTRAGLMSKKNQIQMVLNLKRMNLWVNLKKQFTGLP